MATVDSIRELHNELESVCTALEVLFHLGVRDHEPMELATRPTMLRFRELLNSGDRLCGPDDHEAH